MLDLHERKELGVSKIQADCVFQTSDVDILGDKALELASVSAIAKLLSIDLEKSRLELSVFWSASSTAAGAPFADAGALAPLAGGSPLPPATAAGTLAS